MNWSLRTRVATANWLGLLLLATVSLVSGLSLRQFLSAADEVARSQDVLKTSERLRGALMDAETAQRGLLLSNDDQYLAPLEQARADMAPALQHLRELAGGDPSLLRRIEALTPIAEAKLEWSVRIARAHREGGLSAAQRLFRTNRGKFLMDRARLLIDDIVAEEEHRLDAARERTRADGRRTLRTLGAFVALALVLMALWGAFLDRSIRTRENAESAMRENEQRLAGLLDAAPDPIIIAGADGLIVLANAQAEKTFGYAKGELLGGSVDTLVPERFRAAHTGHRSGYAHKPARRMMGTGRELFARRKDGTEFPADITLSPLTTAQGVLAIAIVRDMTEQRAAQEALRVSQERLNLALAAADLGAWELDMKTDQGVRTLRHDRIFGYETLQSEWGLARFMSEHVAPEHHAIVEEAFARANQTGVFRLDCPITRKDGARRWIRCTGALVKDEHGVPARLMGIIADTTREKEEETALSEANAGLAEANKELESFSYSVSHDLRAPLRAIDGFSLAVLEDSAGRLSPESSEHLARVRAASQRMAHLIDDLLNLSRITRQELRPTSVDLSALAESVVAELRAANAGRAVDCAVQPGLAAHGDEGLLRVIVQNLLGNAWKFTSKTERARVEFASFLQPDETKVFYARDNGAGFDDTYAHKLFGAFQRLHSEAEFPGTGVGLATIQRVVRRHGGRVWAESTPGRGATFYFTIPDAPRRSA